MTDRTDNWPPDDTRVVKLDQLDERLHRYRLSQEKVERNLAQSLERYGQLSPVVVCVLEDDYVLVDGFKRLRAARRLEGLNGLVTRRLDLDEQGAKAAIYNLNRIGQRTVEVEEAWIVQALVRDDGLSQVEVAHLLGRHKSWVNRRLAMLEQLCSEARQQLSLGLLTPSLARQLTRLPRGNQASALTAARESSLTSREFAGVIDLLLASSTQQQTDFVLSQPRRALSQTECGSVYSWDPRLTAAGNRIAKRLYVLLEHLSKMDSWLRYKGRAALSAGDREPLQEHFRRLTMESRQVAESSDDLVKELELP